MGMRMRLATTQQQQPRFPSLIRLGRNTSSICALCLFFVFGASPGIARGQTPAPAAASSPPPSAATQSTPLEWTAITLPDAGFRSATLTSGLGWTQLGEDHFLGLAFGTVIDLGLFRTGIHAPLNLRIIDNDPESETTVREEDWDETSDWFRIIRFIEVGHAHRGPLYARYGELLGSNLGHGTLVDSYYNTIQIDHYQAGLSFRLDLGPVGGQVMLDNVADPEIFGMRNFIRPFQFIQDSQGLLEKMAVGLTLLTDANAPLTIDREVIANKVVPVVTDTHNLAADRRATFFIGLDVELRVVENREFLVEPYVDINAHLNNGTGTHWGILNLWDPSDDFQLSLRTEYRLLGPGYIPSYINAIYEVERYQFYNSADKDADTFDDPQRPGFFPGTKLQFAKNHADSVESGALLELGGTLYRALRLKARYQGSGRPNDDELWLQSALPYLGDLQVSATYLKRRASGFEELFDPDKAMLVADIRYKAWGPIAVQALMSREWRVREDEGYETTTTWQFGAVGDFSF